MTKQIFILGTTPQSNGDFIVNGVFWLTAPPNRVIPVPSAKSVVPHTSADELLNIRSGLIVETPFTTAVFPAGTSVLDVQTAVQQAFVTAQAELTDSNPIEGLIGSVFNGSAWLPPALDPSFIPWLKSLSPPLTIDGRQRVAIEKSDASKKNFFSHDFTDPTTWYSTSYRVVENATDSGDHQTYNLSHQVVVDLFHGKIWGEDFLRDANGYSYRVAVRVDGVSKNEVDPHTQAGDFIVNYMEGKIVFSSPQSADAVVQVEYHHMVDSTFVVKPDPGKLLYVTFAEAQFSRDIILTDTVAFQPYGLVDVFAPQLTSANIVPSGTLIPLGSPVLYKTLRDYQTEAVKAYPAYPAMGGTGWRGMAADVIIMDWDYLSSTSLRSDMGMEIRIKLQHDVPFGGSYATCSFYCTSEALT
jgi:hypothetical protein